MLCGLCLLEMGDARKDKKMLKKSIRLYESCDGALIQHCVCAVLGMWKRPSIEGV